MAYRPPDRLLRVDLSAGTVSSEPVPERWRERYLGGKGIGARYLYEAVPPGADPLGPDNVLVFATGPLSGLLPGEVRYAAVTKSPLTGAFLDSYSGGEFAASLTGALGEHLAVLVSGRADAPTVLEIEDGSGALAPAADLAGADAVETAAAFPDAAVACVGPAGEHRVAYATIAADGAEHHAGRGGAGAVMGAKRLTAVVARGERPAALAGLREAYRERYLEDDTGRWQAASGTLESVDFANEVGVLSTRGFREGTFEGADHIGIEAVRDAASGREGEPDGIPGDFRVPGPDGESVPRGGTAMSLGAGLGIDEFDAVAALGETCDRLGVDVISAGAAVAWAVRAGEAGVVDRELSFGDPDGARALIEEIATRSTPLGDALADGVEAAAAELGGEALLPTVKAMATPGYDPRGATAMALAYATSDRGACHRRARPVEVEPFREWSDADRVRAVIEDQDVKSTLWSLVADDFVGAALRDDLGAEWLGAVGIERNPDELYAVGERTWTLTRLFNLREGLGRADDDLPQTFETPLPDGPAGGRSIDRERFEDLRSRYYAERDWSADGVPTAACLDRLDLAETADAATPVADRRPADD